MSKIKEPKWIKSFRHWVGGIIFTIRFWYNAKAKRHIRAFFRFFEDQLGSIAVLLFIIITVSFCIGEDWSWRPINESKISAYATSLAALFTAVTVFLLYRQNKNFINESRAAKQPDLFIHDITFNVQDVPGSSPLFYQSGLWKRTLELELINIGLGIAKGIQYQWQFSKDNITPLLEQHYSHLISQFAYKQMGEISYLDLKDTSRLVIPSYYTYTFSELLTEIDKPMIQLFLTYTDVYNIIWQREYRLIGEKREMSNPHIRFIEMSTQRLSEIMELD